MSSTTSASVAPENSTTYDDVPYPSHPYEATHPDNIYSLARLFQFGAKLPDEARILELGCASGGNLIPVAAQIPTAQFIGVDLSNKQIDEGKASIAKLGLKNIELLPQSFEDIDDSFGQFDYILCHGVFSWVPPSAQRSIFQVCRDRLAPQGIAYISYNAYPGWFMRGMIREMMLHHVKNIQDPIEKVKQARGLLSFIVESTEGQNTPYAQSVKQELQMLSKHSDAYLFHDHLEVNNHPMFFYQFMDIAKEYGLQFMSESNLASMITSNLPAKAAESLSKLTNDLYHRSQYTDFVTNRMFRQSLLCHANQAVHRHIDESKIQDAYFAGSYTTDGTAGPDLDPNNEISFKCANGRMIKTKNPAVKAMFQVLTESWPAAIKLSELNQKVTQLLSQSLVVGEQEQISIPKSISAHLVHLLVRGDVDFRFIPSRFVMTVDDRPRVSALSRLQAQTGSAITTARHNMLNPDALTRLLIQVMDGTRTKDELIQYVSDMIASGTLKVTIQGNQPVDMSTVHRATVDRVLEQLRKNALLV